jgi:hypothetical protein
VFFSATLKVRFLVLSYAESPGEKGGSSPDALRDNAFHQPALIIMHRPREWTNA